MIGSSVMSAAGDILCFILCGRFLLLSLCSWNNRVGVSVNLHGRGLVKGEDHLIALLVIERNGVFCYIQSLLLLYEKCLA